MASENDSDLTTHAREVIAQLSETMRRDLRRSAEAPEGVRLRTANALRRRELVRPYAGHLGLWIPTVLGNEVVRLLAQSSALDHWAVNSSDRSKLRDFWDWLVEHQQGSVPELLDVSIEEALDAYHGIDRVKLEQERRALLASCHQDVVAEDPSHG